MKKRNILLLGCLLFLFCSPIVFANTKVNPEEVAFESFTDELDAEIASFEGQELPGMLSPFINDETLEVVLTLDSGEEITFVLVIENSVIVQAGQGGLEAPGYQLIISQEFVESTKGEAFGKAIRDGLTTGEVSYEADGLWRKLKLSMMLAAVDIAALFQ